MKKKYLMKVQPTLLGQYEKRINSFIQQVSLNIHRCSKKLHYKKSTGNKYYTTELTIVPDGTDVNVSEYGLVDNDGNIGTISVSRVGDTVNLTITPEVGITPVTVRFARIGLKA